MTKGKVELGKQLYFDPRVSLDGTVSCATCHNPEKGWTDNLDDLGRHRRPGRRPERPDGPEHGLRPDDVLGRPRPVARRPGAGAAQNPIEMGKQSYKEIIERLRTIPGYREQFQKVFGTDVTLDGMAKAIAAFERVAALSGNSTYDKYNEGDMKALTESEKRGMVLFGLRLDQDDEFKTDVVAARRPTARSCHAGFNFTDEQFHNLGIGWDEKQGKFADLGRFGDRRRSAPRTRPSSARSRPRRSATSPGPAPTCTTAA